MKHCLILAVAAFFFLGSAQAQDHRLARFYNMHRGTATTFKFALGPGMMRLTSTMIGKADKKSEAADIKKLISNVHRVKIYAMAGYEDSPLPPKDLINLKQQLINKDHFESLMEVRDKGSLVHILNRGTDDELGNVVMLIQDTNNIVIVHVHTTLKIDDINLLIDRFNKKSVPGGRSFTVSL